MVIISHTTNILWLIKMVQKRLCSFFIEYDDLEAAMEPQIMKTTMGKDIKCRFKLHDWFVREKSDIDLLRACCKCGLLQRGLFDRGKPKWWGKNYIDIYALVRRHRRGRGVLEWG